ncbi:MAG: hypothetical protein ACP5G7_07530 [Anaerolineae bacterium]
MRVGYRVWQALRRATAGLRSRDLSVVAEVLPPEAYALFERMPAADQDHALCVHARVRDSALALQQAALMHDVAKGLAGVGLWDRTLHVLRQHLSPSVGRWLVSLGHRERLASLEQHAAKGAVLCSQVGLSREVCELVAHHDGSVKDEGLSERQHKLLEALRAADEAC